jgi:peptidoglycan hydrolase-like protein with peptidoglycan-binding domain
MKHTFVVLGLSALLTWPVLAIGQQTSPTPGTSGAGTHMEQQGQAGQQSQQAMHHEQSQQAMHHEQIAQAQRQLKAAGFDPGPLDGILGESTRSALREFQQKHSLPQTGQLDEATRQQLMAQAPQQSPGMQAPRESTPGR